MKIKVLTSDQKVKLLLSGGGMTIDAGSATQDQLIRYAQAAAKGKAVLSIKNYSSRTFDQAIAISQAGEGKVAFCEETD